MSDIWIVFALLAVFGKTTYYTIQKRLLDDTESVYRLGYIAALYGWLVVTPPALYVLYTDPPEVAWTVFGIVSILGVVELVGLLMYLKALELCDMSIASPLKKMKPTLVAVSEPFVLGATVGPILLAAATSTAVGGYVVLMKGRDLLAPFRRITEPGPALALGTAGVYAVLSLGSRFGASRLSPFVFGMVVFSVMLLGYTILTHRRGELPTARETVSRSYMAVGATGAFRSIMVWCAYALASATMVSVVNQLTILLDVLVGGTLLQEGNTKQRILGALMILAGVVVVLLV